MSSERTEDCCTSTPLIVAEGYDRVGTTKETAKGLKYYESASDVKRKDLAVIVIFDILGPDMPQTDQQVDRISKGLGVKAVMPWMFGPEGAYHDISDKENMWKWIAERASPETIVERLEDIISVLKSEGYTNREIATRQPGYFVAAASIHGRAYTAEQAPGMLCPFYNMPSQNEGAQPEFMAALPEANGIKAKSKELLFGDVPHGFAAARGKWKEDPNVKRRAEEAINEYVSWVKEVVPEN